MYHSDFLGNKCYNAIFHKGEVTVYFRHVRGSFLVVMVKNRKHRPPEPKYIANIKVTQPFETHCKVYNSQSLGSKHFVNDSCKPFRKVKKRIVSIPQTKNLNKI